jgi:peroxiredoxin
MASAVGQSCNANINDSSVLAGSAVDFQVTITNTGSSPINWIRVTQPSANFSFNSSYSPGWSDSGNNSYAYESGNSLMPGSTTIVYINAQINVGVSESANWIVDVSDDGGASTSSCTGNLTTSISPPSALNILDIWVNNLSSSSARINWTTDQPSTTKIRYGLDNNYTIDIPENTILVTDHYVDLTSLSPGTIYYYMISGTDVDNNTVSSDGNTFTTLGMSEQSNVPVQYKQNVNPANNGGQDKRPPTIQMSLPSKVNKLAPQYVGLAVDDNGIALIEYSADNGLNWLVVDNINGLGGRQADFSFTPINLEDGDYLLLVRAVDVSGNSVTTESINLVIDNLAPHLGGIVIYLGSQVVSPGDVSDYEVIDDTDYRMTLGFVGGPNIVSVTAIKSENTSVRQEFSMVKSTSTGLWSGSLVFQEAGRFSLQVQAEDGAGNKINTALRDIVVKSSARVMDNSGPIPGARVAVYTKELQTNSWILWDSQDYSQANPKNLQDDGSYNIFLPPGEYYLKFTAPSYKDVISNIFKLDQPTIVSKAVKMKKRPGVSVAGLDIRIPWPSFRPSLSIDIKSSPTSLVINNLYVPSFELKRTDNTTVSLISILGKPTIMIFGSTWGPVARQQMSVAQSIDAEQINVISIVSGESLSSISAYARQSDIRHGIVADIDNKLISQMPSSMLPTTYFINRQGVIEGMSSRLLTKQEMIDNVRF